MSSATLSTLIEAHHQSLPTELEGNLFRNVDGFLAKYFDDKPWSAAINDTMRNDDQSAQVVRKLTADVPDLDSSETLMEWLAVLQSVFAAESGSFRLDTMPSAPLISNIYLETTGPQSASGSTRVFGQFHYGDFLAVTPEGVDLLHFCVLAQQLFKAQLARHFLHAFLIHGVILELWVFDRSGPYSSQKINLQESPHILVYILAGYIRMNDEESGFSTFVKRLEPTSDGYVTLNPGDKQLHLQPKLIARPGSLVGLRTTYYTASASTTGEPCILVKFS